MYVKFEIFIIFFLALSCSGITSLNSEEKKQIMAPAVSNATSKDVFFSEKELVLRPGEVILLKFLKPQTISNGNLWCGEQKYLFQEINGYILAFISETYFSELKLRECVWKSADTESLSIKVATLKVAKKTFPQEYLKVNQKTVDLSEKDFARVKEEQALLNSLYASSSGVMYFEAPFKRPLKSSITSHYGFSRVYNKVKKGQHLGTDFRAKVGIPIPSSNRGKVVLAQNLFFTGYTVIVDHGLDIFTIYGHMSELNVKVGDMVDQGTILGKSGSTGRSSGPHLHWGVKIANNLIDGMQLVKMTQKEMRNGIQKLPPTP